MRLPFTPLRQAFRHSSVPWLAAFGLCAVLGGAVGVGAEPPIPQLRRQGNVDQLIVDGQPFLIRGGEINNSSATNPAHLAPSWARFKALNLNTLIVPAYWDLIEPDEGRFDFTSVDAILRQARTNRFRLVLLWFGSWKNSMSCYAPGWVKRNPARFPRAMDLDGQPQEILTPFSEENRRTDAAAFAALLHHLRETDGTTRTVILVQVENEIGMIPTARDHSVEADRAFAAMVPAELLRYLEQHFDELAPELRQAWLGAGRRRSGNWSEVFGSAGEEIFMAWHFARYTDAVAAAGRHEYPLPMYVNAALIRPGYQPGQYPSAGPLPHLFDIWRAGAPNVDFFSPDIYFQDFAGWARRYRRPSNPLFIPETMRSVDASVNALYAYGADDALGFSPFGIESIADPAAQDLSASFGLVAQLEPLILAHRGDGSMTGFLSAGPEQKQPQQVRLGRYVMHATFEHGVPPDLAVGTTLAASPAALPSGGLAIALGPDEFLFAGTGLVITFDSQQPHHTAGILQAEEGQYVNGVWQNILWLGGDQTNQGRHIRLEPGRFSIQRVRLYSIESSANPLNPAPVAADPAPPTGT